MDPVELAELVRAIDAMTQADVENDRAIRLIVNDHTVALDMEYVVGSGRDVGTKLATVVLNEDRLPNNGANIVIDDDRLNSKEAVYGGWNGLDFWLMQGNMHYKSYLLDMEHLTALEELTDFFELSQLSRGYRSRKKQRVEARRTEFDRNQNFVRLSSSSGESNLILNKDNIGVVCQFSPILVRIGDLRGNLWLHS